MFTLLPRPLCVLFYICIVCNCEVFAATHKILSNEIVDVHVDAHSVCEAWQVLASQVSVQMVLVCDENSASSTNIPFKYDSEKCSVLELLNAFTNAVSWFTYTSDPTTGVVWVHPQKLPYGQLLSARVKVSGDAIAVPMLSGVLSGLRGIEASGIRLGMQRGFFFQDTFDCPVNLRKGVVSVRDILNQCVFQNPAHSFVIIESKGALFTVSPVNHGQHSVAKPGISASSFWSSAMNTNMCIPEPHAIVAALSHESQRVRDAARSYLEMIRSWDSFPQLYDACTSRDETIWTGIASLVVLVRTQNATHTLSLGKLHDILNSESQVPLAPELRVLASVEIARVTRNSTILKEAAKIALSEAEMSKVWPDLIRNLRYSAFLREQLLILKPNWAGLSVDQIAQLGNQHFFSLP